MLQVEVYDNLVLFKRLRSLTVVQTLETSDAMLTRVSHGKKITKS